MVSSKEKYLIFGFCAAIFLIAIVPQIFQSLFVHHSGKFNGIGEGFAVILIAAILLKWKFAKLLFNFVFMITIVIEVFILLKVWQQYFLPHLILLIVMIGLTIIFNYSRTIKNHFINQCQQIIKSI